MNATALPPVILTPVEFGELPAEALTPLVAPPDVEERTPEPIIFVDVVPPPEMSPAPRRGFCRRVVNGIASACEWVFGAVALVLGLSVLAAAPVLQFLCFGYLLEVGGRVARTGRLRDGFVGVRKAARLGSMAIGCSVMLLVLQVVASLSRSAELVDPGGRAGRNWRAGLLVLTGLTVLHMVAACARGGRLRYFLWPFGTPLWLARRLRQGRLYASARDEVWEYVRRLRLSYYFRLGVLGFLGTMAWLVVPVSLIAAGRRVPPVGLLGAVLLGVVAMALPFLQMRFVTEGRFGALFEYRSARRCYRRAPWAFAAALVVTLATAVPLYLLKIEMIPRETAWLPSLVFLGFIAPARLLTGWAYARASRRDRPRHWFFRALARLGMLPAAALYVLILFLSQFTAWKGIWSLYEQHAFLLPVPFLNM